MRQNEVTPAADVAGERMQRTAGRAQVPQVRGRLDRGRQQLVLERGVPAQAVDGCAVRVLQARGRCRARLARVRHADAPAQKQCMRSLTLCRSIMEGVC